VPTLETGETEAWTEALKRQEATYACEASAKEFRKARWLALVNKRMPGSERSSGVQFECAEWRHLVEIEHSQSFVLGRRNERLAALKITRLTRVARAPCLGA
jgi:hypothetical protein